MFSNSPSLADIKAVTDDNGMGNGSIWLILILILLFGAGGMGLTGGSNNALSTDVATLERKMDGLANGIADSAFALNNAITGGFASVQNTATQGFAGLNTVINNGFSQNAITNLNGFNNVTSAISNSSREIIENANNNTQRILDTIQQNEIQTLRDNLQTARFQLSQQEQSGLLINELKPCPIPAYTVANPYASYSCGCSCGS